MERDSNVNLKWDAHQATLKSVFDSLLDAESLADCTVGAEGQHLKAHKIMLSACSRYFELLFSHNCGKHIVIILPGVKFHILKALTIFIYRGEVLVPQDDLDALLKLADFLQVKGLSDAGSAVSEKKQTHTRRNKSPTYSEHTPSQCRVSAQTYERPDSPELLEISGCSSQNFTKMTPTLMSIRKRKKNNWHSSREKAPLKQDLAPLSQDVTRHIPLQRAQFPEKCNSACSLFTEPVSGQSLTGELPVFSEGNFSEHTLSREEFITLKPLNPIVETSVGPAVSRENPILQTLTETKRENPVSFSEDCVDTVVFDSDQKICDNSIVASDIMQSSFCDEGSFTQQIQFQVAEWTPIDPAEQTSVSYNRFKCQSCNRSYRHNRDLLRHLKYECGKEPQFQCSHCSVRFTHKHTLKAHMVKHTR